MSPEPRAPSALPRCPFLRATPALTGTLEGTGTGRPWAAIHRARRSTLRGRLPCSPAAVASRARPSPTRDSAGLGRKEGA